MIETIFWIIVVVVVIGLVWYFLKQKKGPAQIAKPEERFEVPTPEKPLETPPSETPPSETPPSDIPPTGTPTL